MKRKLNSEVKAKWLEALRSGKYVQGKSFLRHKSDRFCCLGVLCSLYQQETGEGKWVLEDVDGMTPVFKFSTENDTSTTVLPNDVYVWAGLGKNDEASRNPFVNGGTLAELNDDGNPFEAIADMIEKEL